ncbi:MAG: membrane protein insertase YidC [Muribaculaceae bacterium]|nr:membrane protein insertase YidC [Muribaculaceae bacterium]
MNSSLKIILVAAAVFFGMMLLNNKREDNSQKPQAQDEVSADNETLTVSDAELALIPSIVREIGERDTTGGHESFNYVSDNVSLKVTDGKLGGIVQVDSFAVDVDSVLARRFPVEMNVTRQDIAYNTLAKELKEIGVYRKFASLRKAVPMTDTVSLHNDVLALEFDNHGGIISRATLLDPKYRTFFPYKDDKNKIDSAQVQVFNPDDKASYWFNISYNNNDISTCHLYFTPKQVNDSVVEMTVDLGDGARWGYRYTLPQGDSYIVRMDVIQYNTENVLPQNTSQMTMCWTMNMPRLERGLTFEERNSGIYYRYAGETPDNINGNSSKTEQLKHTVQWLAFKDQFFSTIMIPRKGFISGAVEQQAYKTQPDATHIKKLAADMEVPYAPMEQIGATIDIFIGPNLYPLLKDIDGELGADDGLSLTRVIPLGWNWLRWINTLIVIPVFTFLSGFVSNYGIIILLLTIFIKIIIFPFTYKSYLSQAKMRLLAPEIKEINEKYPGKENAMVRQQKTMALYSKAGASPFSGCLPLLLQMPILIAMFSFFPSCIELRGQSFLWVQDLASPDVIFTLPFSIPFYGKEVSLFCLLMTVTNIMYTRINMKNQPSSSSMPGMKWMMYLMPVMFLFFFNSYPAALSYYYFLSLLITIIQTWVFRRCVNEEKLRRKMAENAAKPKKKSGFMARLEEAQRKQQAALREQQKGRRR